MSYSHYRGRCIGRVIYFLRYYCPHYIAEQALIGENKVAYGAALATYKWSNKFGEVDVPEFNFIGRYDIDVEHYVRAQRDRRAEAIRDCLILPPRYNNEFNVDSRVVKALATNAYREAKLWADIMKKSCNFFIASIGDEPDLLCFETETEVYRYIPDTGWILIEQIKED